MKISLNITKIMGVSFIAMVLAVSSFGFAMTAKAETNTATQLELIQTLLKQIELLQAQLAQIQGGGSSVSKCVHLSRSMYLGSKDSDTVGEVSKLQQFLTSTGHYTYGEVTGYYGPATQRAVQAWQAANGVVSSGGPETTGYGVVGPSTRSAIAKVCTAQTNKPQSFSVSIPKTSFCTGEKIPITILSNQPDVINMALRRGPTKSNMGEFAVGKNNGVTIIPWEQTGVKGTTLPGGTNLQIVAAKTYGGTELGITPYFSIIECTSDSYDDLDEPEGDPSITLNYPKRNVTFDKSESNDDVIIKWKAEDVPENTNVTFEIEAVETYAGAFVTGSAGQIKAHSGPDEYRIAIDIDGTLGAGEYKVRLSLEECHSLGCNINPNFPGYEEDLEVYDRSNYGYFTVIDGDNASVTLHPSGYGDVDEIDVNVTDKIDINYYPTGDIDECEVIAEYNDGGEQSVVHPWSNAILIGQHGEATFKAYGIYPSAELKEIRVECSNEDVKIVASDTVEVNVGSDEKSDYEIIVDGDTESGTDVSEAEARSRCLKEANAFENLGERVQCSWDGEKFFDATNWKG